MQIKMSDYIITYDDSPELHKKVFDMLLAWYIKHEAFHGETICQCDGPSLDAINILSDIADDVIKFKA